MVFHSTGAPSQTHGTFLSHSGFSNDILLSYGNIYNNGQIYSGTGSHYINGLGPYASGSYNDTTNRTDITQLYFANSTSSANASIGIGGRVTQGIYVKGTYGETIIYDKTLTTAERQQIETYLAEKWGISYAGSVLDIDSLSGGTGNDVFIFRNNSRQDVISAFDNPGAGAGDTIQLLSNINCSGITNWATLQPHFSQVGSDTVIDLAPATPGTHSLEPT